MQNYIVISDSVLVDERHPALQDNPWETGVQP